MRRFLLYVQLTFFVSVLDREKVLFDQDVPKHKPSKCACIEPMKFIVLAFVCSSVVIYMCYLKNIFLN